MEKVVLAFSGGLDTSFCIPYLKHEKGLDVYSAFADTTGLSTAEYAALEEKAYQLGVKEHVNLPITENYYQNCIKYLIWGNVLRNNSYPVSVSSERFFQALAVVEYAKKIGASYIAHGSTGAGNDQVRFDLAIQILAPSIKIITPIRALSISRKEEISYLKKHGFDFNWERAAYSVNEGLWGTTVGGQETLGSKEALPEHAYPHQLEKTTASKLSLTFKDGELCAVNGEAFDSSLKAIQKVEQLANPYAIGRDIHVGDSIIGLKGRVGFSAAAALIIIKAHELLEKHCLGKWQIHWKGQLGNWYGMMLHEGLYLDPVMRDIEQFLENSQRTVNGTVFIQLHPYRYELLGIESENDLMRKEFGVYGEENNNWTAEEAKGFIKILANPLKIYHQVNSIENQLEPVEA